MRDLRRFTTKEVIGLPAGDWVRAENHFEEVQQLRGQLGLYFSPADVRQVANDRDEAQRLVRLYESALQTVARTMGRSFNGAQDVNLLNGLVGQVVNDLIICRELKRKRQ